MTNERFNELVNGPLNHPMITFRLTRLAQALLHVVSAGGDQGERALEEFCHAREQLDNCQDG